MIWNLVKADFLKVRGNNKLWLFIFGTTLVAGIVNYILAENSAKIVTLYSLYLLLCFPLGVAMLAGFICKVDEDNWALLYTKNHRFRYFVSKTILLALLSFLSIVLLYVGFIPAIIHLPQSSSLLVSLGMVFAIYYGLLFFLFPFFISLYIFVRGSLIPVFIILIFYFLYPSLVPIASMLGGDKNASMFVKVDRAISDYLPQNQFDKEFIVKTFLKNGEIDPGLNEGITAYSESKEELFKNFSKKGDQITHSLITGQSKSLYIGLVYFLLFGAIGYMGMRRREIKT